MLVWLTAPEALTADIGGKGRGLARLVAAGLPTPGGCVLTTAAYHRFVEVNGLTEPLGAAIARPDLTSFAAARAAAATLAPALAVATLPPELTEAIEDASHGLQFGKPVALSVAVRSSARSEDGGQASSAGLYETALFQQGAANIADAVLRCYRSLWSARALHYRAIKGIDQQREAMAVVIMPMVDASVAGVAFTCHPVTGSHDEIMINAGWGVGEALVSGRVTPDQFVVTKRDQRVRERMIADKTAQSVADSASPSGTALAPAPASRVSEPSLTDAQLQALTALCLRAETLYGVAVDLEWAFVGDECFLLQARPITSAR